MSLLHKGMRIYENKRCHTVFLFLTCQQLVVLKEIARQIIISFSIQNRVRSSIEIDDTTLFHLLMGLMFSKEQEMTTI